jgi:hypothetical protein
MTVQLYNIQLFMPELFIHYCVYLLYRYIVNISRLPELPEQHSYKGE